MFSCLRHGAIGGGDDENGALHLCCTCDHVLKWDNHKYDVSSQRSQHIHRHQVNRIFQFITVTLNIGWKDKLTLIDYLLNATSLTYGPVLRANKPAVLKSPRYSICSLWTWANSHILEGRLFSYHLLRDDSGFFARRENNYVHLVQKSPSRLICLCKYLCVIADQRRR